MKETRETRTHNPRHRRRIQRIHVEPYDEDRWLEVKAVGQNTIKIDGDGCLNT